MRSIPPRLPTLALLAFGGAATIGGARAEPPATDLALRGVMQQLGRDMQTIVGAIATEDWALVASTAPAIARHPQPATEEKLRILGWLGSNAGKFRSYDSQVHDAAAALTAAAAQTDGEAVIAAFASTQRACLQCHREFRAAFGAHFRGTKP
ncbi:MAG: cytochrome c [Dokdonella sp.]|uniref:cytochrome c n=1 Tax=Dokdonella sp. TaxID=2291710 RepID=UPI0025C481E1|nr:cytochrome c [Dokdonella sp.]MBX3699706.1 cytochrome c [Dokdonella sp.]MCW5579466.1 cytochrome c [Dokdonella sp.]